MKVKVCGITNNEDAVLASELGADALGFIFYRNSKRFIDPADAAVIISGLPPLLVKVGVFVNESHERVNSIAADTGLNIIQLHGDENIEYIKQIKYPIIKALRIGEFMNWKLLEDFESFSVLLDKYDPNQFGGTGKSFSWSEIPEKYSNKIILAGGVSVDNIEKIFYEIKPYAVDVSSSLEEYPGKKDHKKMKEFFSILNELRKKC